MIHFRPILPRDKQSVMSCIPQGIPLNCDYGFANMVGWREKYHTEIAIEEGVLYIRFYINGHRVYMPPVGEVHDNKENLIKAIERIRENSLSDGEPMMLFGVLRDQTEQIERLFPNSFRFLPDRDLSDYVYLRTELVELAGKKYQPKRNHINKFISLFPNYQYKPLTEENVSDCFQIEKMWFNINAYGKEKQEMIDERRMLHFCLKHLKELDIIGGTIYVGERLVAFTFGSMVNDVTFDVCVEKADAGYEGAFAIINRDFCSHLPERFIYINREEDMGLEGLRKSKLSYQPQFILEKLTAIPICNDSQCWEMKKIYQRSFNDDDEFISFYFKNRYSKENTITESVDGRIVSEAQILDYTLSVWNTNLKTVYLSAVCTLPEYRRRGFITKLISESHQKMYDDGAVFSSLIPANDHLWDLYSKFGYTPCFYQNRVLFQNDLGTQYSKNGISCHECIELDDRILDYVRKKMSERKNYLFHSDDDMEIVFEYYRKFNGLIVEAMKNSHIVGLLFSEKDAIDNSISQVEDVFFDDEEIRDLLLSASCNMLSCSSLYYPGSIERNSERKGMIRIINAKKALLNFASFYVNSRVDLTISDNAINENNFSVSISDGQCRFVDISTNEDFEKIDISELAHRLFLDTKCYMTMMLN